MPKVVQLICCNPFKLSRHSVHKGLRQVQPFIIELKPDTIHPKSSVCISCHKQLGQPKKNIPEEKPIPKENEPTISVHGTESEKI